jgi:hypothetical protein
MKEEEQEPSVCNRHQHCHDLHGAAEVHVSGDTLKSGRLASYIPDRTRGKWNARPNVGGNRRADEMLAEDQGMNRRVRLTVGLGLPMLKQLRHGKTDISCNLPKKNGRDIAARVERYGRCAACCHETACANRAGVSQQSPGASGATTSAALRTGTLPTTQATATF